MVSVSPIVVSLAQDIWTKRKVFLDGQSAWCVYEWSNVPEHEYEIALIQDGHVVYVGDSHRWKGIKLDDLIDALGNLLSHWRSREYDIELVFDQPGAYTAYDIKLRDGRPLEVI
jgi:hypothetical protein